MASCGQGRSRGIRSTTAHRRCLLRGRRGDTAGLAGGKEPHNFGLHRDTQRAGVGPRAEIIQLPPTTLPLADQTWVLLTGALEGG
jgi:hypothetical protein